VIEMVKRSKVDEEVFDDNEIEFDMADVDSAIEDTIAVREQLTDRLSKIFDEDMNEEEIEEANSIVAEVIAEDEEVLEEIHQSIAEIDRAMALLERILSML